MSKSAIYAANTSPATINLSSAQPSAVLPLGTVIRRFGCNIQLSGNGILLDGEGYYDVDSSIVLTPASAGNYTISLHKDGVPVPGATQAFTATSGGTISYNIPALVRLQCCNSGATLTLVLTTSATLPVTVTVTNVGVVVEKI